MANSELTSALRIQGRVIWALILREVKCRYQGYKLGYTWALIEPLLHLAGWLLVMIFLKNRHALIGNSVITFVTTGLIPFRMFMSVASFVTTALKSNRPLLSYSVVMPVDLLISRWLLESATLIVVAIIIFSTLVLVGESPPPDNLVGIAAACAMLLLLGFGTGIFNAVMTQMFPFYEYVWDIVSRVMYFTSGIFFIVDNLPLIFQHYLWYNPAVHAVVMFRDAYYTEYKSNFPYPPYTLLFTVGLIFIGLALERRVRGRRFGE